MTAAAAMTRWADALCALATAGERIDVHVEHSHREGLRLTAPEVVLPRGDSLTALVRLSLHDRDGYVALTDTDMTAATEAIAAVRAVLSRWGRPVPTTCASHTDRTWSLEERTDHSITPHRLQTLDARLRATADEARSTVRDAAIVVEQTHAVFASTHQTELHFDRTSVEGRCILGSTRQGNTPPSTAITHAHRIDLLDFSDSITEAAWHARALTAQASTSPPIHSLLLLPPRVAARILAAVVRDVASARGTHVAATTKLMDDGRAMGSPHAALFDHEGTLTGVSPFLAADGAVTLPHSRATAQDGDRLGGHAIRLEYDTVPEPWPRNVLMTASSPPADDTNQAWFCHAVAGADVTHIRSSDRMTIRLSTAVREANSAMTDTGVIVVTASAAEILEALRPLTDKPSFLPSREFTVGSGWATLDVSALPSETMPTQKPRHAHEGRGAGARS
jgi:predicted Zn-dependent protease